jgi:hypothetical protein
MHRLDVRVADMIRPLIDPNAVACGARRPDFGGKGDNMCLRRFAWLQSIAIYEFELETVLDGSSVLPFSEERGWPISGSDPVLSCAFEEFHANDDVRVDH